MDFRKLLFIGLSIVWFCDLSAQEFFNTYREAFLEYNPYGDDDDMILPSTDKKIKSAKIYLINPECFKRIIDERLENIGYKLLKNIKKKDKKLHINVEYYPNKQIKKFSRQSYLFDITSDYPYIYSYTVDYIDDGLFYKYYRNDSNYLANKVIIKNNRVLNYGNGYMQYYYRNDGLLDYVIHNPEQGQTKYQFSYKDSLDFFFINVMIDNKIYEKYEYFKNGKLSKRYMFDDDDFYSFQYIYHPNGYLAVKRDSIFYDKKSELNNISFYNYNEQKVLMSKIETETLWGKYPCISRTIYFYRKNGELEYRIKYNSTYGVEVIESIAEYHYEYY